MKSADFLALMSSLKMYDLTQRLNVHTPPWPSYMPLQVQYFKRIAGAHMGQGANGQIIKSSNHVGTHIDGEIHFHASGRTIGEVPMHEWVGPAAVADISDAVEDYGLYTSEMIEQRVEVNQGDILIINTGYHRYGWDQRHNGNGVATIAVIIFQTIISNYFYDKQKQEVFSDVFDDLTFVLLMGSISG